VDADDVVLLDAEAVHREHPRTFSIPRRVVRDSLVAGDLVKLLFRIEPPSGSIDVERMWVEVVSSADRAYVGRLADTPAYLHDLTVGDRIAFGPEHVAAREAGPDDPLYSNPDQFAVVSRRVLDDDAWPALLERHDIPDPRFSGWFVLAGDETEGYRADPGNFLPVAQAALFDRFRVLDSGLEGPVGTRMVWVDADAEYSLTSGRSEGMPAT
jgi:hypothetical protein